MQYRKLGNTDLDVSAICQGCWSIIPEDSTWGGNALQDSIGAIHTSLDAGINFFDTAEGYGGGSSETVLAQAFDGIPRDQVIIASKASPSHFAPDELKAACERSLQFLKTDYIDLYQLHWPSSEVPLSETWGALQELIDEGKVRYGAVSNFGVSFLQDFEAIEDTTPASNQLCYSMIFRAIEYEILPESQRLGLSVLAYSPIAQGLLTGKFASADDVPEGRARTRLFAGDRPGARHGQAGHEQLTFDTLARVRTICGDLGQPMGRVALAWLLAQQGVASGLVGSRTSDQARENAKATELTLDASTLAALDDATADLKAAVGANADMWQSHSRLEKN